MNFFCLFFILKEKTEQAVTEIAGQQGFRCINAVKKQQCDRMYTAVLMKTNNTHAQASALTVYRLGVWSLYLLSQ